MIEEELDWSHCVSFLVSIFSFYSEPFLLFITARKLGLSLDALLKTRAFDTYGK